MYPGVLDYIQCWSERNTITVKKKKKNDTSLLNTLGFHTFLKQDSEVTHSFSLRIGYEDVALSHVVASMSKKKGRLKKCQ